MPVARMTCARCVTRQGARDHRQPHPRRVRRHRRQANHLPHLRHPLRLHRLRPRLARLNRSPPIMSVEPFVWAVTKRYLSPRSQPIMLDVPMTCASCVTRWRAHQYRHPVRRRLHLHQWQHPSRNPPIMPDELSVRAVTSFCPLPHIPRIMPVAPMTCALPVIR